MESSRRISISVLAVWQQPVCLHLATTSPTQCTENNRKCALHDTYNQSAQGVSTRRGVGTVPTSSVVTSLVVTLPPGPDCSLKWRIKKKLRGMVAIVHFLTCLLLNRINFTRFIITNKETHTSKKARYLNKGVTTRKRKQRFVQYGHV